jgi:hypothetical protein
MNRRDPPPLDDGLPPVTASRTISTSFAAADIRRVHSNGLEPIDYLLARTKAEILRDGVIEGREIDDLTALAKSSGGELTKSGRAMIEGLLSDQRRAFDGAAARSATHALREPIGGRRPNSRSRSGERSIARLSANASTPRCASSAAGRSYDLLRGARAVSGLCG